MNRMIMLASAAFQVPHLVLTALMATVIAVVIALLGHRSGRERAYHAGYVFISCMASVVAGSWFMYLIHG